VKHVLIAALLLLAGCSGDPPMVDMADGRVFEPGELTVAAGTTVVWANSSSELHTVTSDAEGDDYFGSGDFSSGAEARKNLKEALIEPGAEYSFTFDEPGTYSYYCIPHEDQNMRGRITVEA
jgi:plastocyanin